MLRRFDAHIEVLAQSCFENPVVDDEFEGASGVIEGGATGSVRVVVKSKSLSAYVKPAKPPFSDLSCLANEKVASDLAYLAKLPVVPMQLVKGHGRTSLPSIVCASYLALPQGRPWNHTMPLTADQQTAVGDQLGAMYAFCAWMADTDHNWNDGNIIIDRMSATDARIAFIDFSWSLTKWWSPPANPTQSHLSAKLGPNSDIKQAGLTKGIEAIEAVASSDIKGIFDRIPEECLASAKRHAYVEALRVRQGELRQLLGVK